MCLGPGGPDPSTLRSAHLERVNAGVLSPGRLQQLSPVADIGTPAQQRPPFPFRHPAPHTELNPVVECFSKALGANRAAKAHHSGLALLGASYEQLIRVLVSTRCPNPPVPLLEHRVPPAPHWIVGDHSVRSPPAPGVAARLPHRNSAVAGRGRTVEPCGSITKEGLSLRYLCAHHIEWIFVVTVRYGSLRI